jgi:hypothetical protein
MVCNCEQLYISILANFTFSEEGQINHSGASRLIECASYQELFSALTTNASAHVNSRQAVIPDEVLGGSLMNEPFRVSTTVTVKEDQQCHSGFIWSATSY